MEYKNEKVLRLMKALVEMNNIRDLEILFNMYQV